jgi:uncharacterized protein YkwD
MKKFLLLSLLCLSNNLYSQTKLEKLIVDEVNAFRTRLCLDSVYYSIDLSKASKHHAKWMSKSGIFSHEETKTVTGIKTLRDIQDRFKEYCMRPWNDGTYFLGSNENIQICFTTKWDTDKQGWVKISLKEIAEGIVTNFEKSPGHKENMMYQVNPRNLRAFIGISVMSGEDGISYVVMNFGGDFKEEYIKQQSKLYGWDR